MRKTSPARGRAPSPTEFYVTSHLSPSTARALCADNYVNIPARDRDNYIYRIISVARLLELFASRTNVLVKPRKWEDPFENFILNSRVRLPSGEIGDQGNRDAVYGQCWTR